MSLTDYVEPDEGRTGRHLLHHRRRVLRSAGHSPHLEIFRKKSVEVLLLSDRVDEWVVSHLTEFDGKPLRSVAQGDLDPSQLGESSEDDAPATTPEEHTQLAERLQKALASRAREVRVTSRLTDSPACLVSDHMMSRNLERMLKEAGQTVPDDAADPGDQPASSGGGASARRDRRAAVRETGPTSCSIRPCSPRADSSTIRPASSGG